MVPLRVLSRTNLAERTSLTSSIFFPSFRLCTLYLSLRSFSDSRPLFSTTSALFRQNSRGGIPHRKLVCCTEAQKCLFVSPFLATLTQTPGMGVPQHLRATLCFRRHMRHVAPLSPVASIDCAHFPSPWDCTPYALQISLRPWQTLAR